MLFWETMLANGRCCAWRAPVNRSKGGTSENEASVGEMEEVVLTMFD